MIKTVIKRDGTKQEFDIQKIRDAILKAGLATKEYGKSHSRLLANQVKTAINSKPELSVEEIQDIVEDVLLHSEFKQTAKAFVLYREQRRRNRIISSALNDVDLVEGYLNNIDWQVKENSNMAYSLQGLNFYLSQEVSKNYWLHKIYPEEIRESHIQGDLHIHDLGSISSYCVGWDLKQLLLQGFGGVEGKISCYPPKHFSTALFQLVNFLFTLQGEAAGAQAVSNFDTLLAPFIRADGLTPKQVKQSLQGFVYMLNVPTRVGFQTPFTNITLDLQPPETMKDEAVVIGGKFQETTYGEYQEEMNVLNDALLSVLLEGDASSRVFTFPIPTYNITKDFDWDNPNLEKLWLVAGKYGIPYFTNYISSDLSPEDARSMCPLAEDTRVRVMVDDAEVTMTIKEMYTRYKEGNVSFKVKTPTGWAEARPNRQQGHVMHRIKLDDGREIHMGENHLQPTKLGILRGEHLTVDMYLPTYLNDEFKFARIIELEKEGKPVTLYCMEVDSPDRLFVLDNGIVTHNCRLRLKHSDLKYRGGGLFGSSPLTGSIGVVTINLPKIGYTASSKEEFFAILEDRINLAKESLEIKRKVLEAYTVRGLYPYTKFYLKEIRERTGGYWSNHFSTIGIIGMHEACINLLGKGIQTIEGKELAEEVLDFIRDRMEVFKEETGHPYNLEATPAEGTSYRLAQIDINQYPDIYTSGSKTTRYYTNSTQLPVNHTDDIMEILDHQNSLQAKYTGGTVLHVFLGEEVKDPEAVKKFIKNAFESTEIPYLSLTPTFSICAEHGYLVGHQETCPECGQPTECFSRPVGYLRPIKQYNKAKQTEFEVRCPLNILS